VGALRISPVSPLIDQALQLEEERNVCTKE